MSDPEFGTDEWFKDYADLIAQPLLIPDRFVRSIAAVALRWAAGALDADQVYEGHVNLLRAKADEIEGKSDE